MPWSAASLVAVAAVTVTAVACASSGNPPPKVATFCPHEDTRSESAIIASGILMRSTEEIMIDGKELSALGAGIKEVLSLIRDDDPRMTRIHARESRYRSGQVTLGLEPELEATIVAIVPERQQTMVRFRTGDKAFDDLNALLHLRGVEAGRLPGAALLCFDGRLNVPLAASLYQMLDNISYAEANYLGGDGPDVDASEDGGTWRVVFRDAYGDCPAGCTGEDLYFFTVTGDSVTEVEAAQANADPQFVDLIALVRR